MNLILSFIIGVLSSITAVFILNKKYNLLLRYLSQIRRYKYQLESQIKNMPFIYRDIEFEVIEGFVDIEIGLIKPNSLELSDTQLSNNINNNLVSRSKILFLGGAGLGKTTLQRYAILSILNKKNKTRFLHKSESVYPIYIPLKLINNIEPSPILKYIFKEISIIHNIEQFCRLLKKEKLMFFLDGYDEISLGDGINFIQAELESIIFSYKLRFRKNKYTDEKFEKIYPLFNSCRIWLSSRKEFFKLNPIANIGEYSSSSTINFSVVQLKGIGNNRLLLIQKIFNKYKKASKKLDQLLDEEYFLTSIERFGDKNLIELSNNPLFLTVMCYIYVNKVKETETHNINWYNNTESLINECIKLLLNDLDEEKARNLSRAFRDGLKNRRNLYYEEKLLFLRYFAAKLFDMKNMVFTLSSIKMEIVEFLNYTKDINAATKSIIISELSNDESRIPNFAFQLIYCGIFIIVQKTNEETYYDFPHRRFREVLAVQSKSDPQEYLNLLEKIKEHQYSEFMMFFKTTQIFETVDFQRETLELLLKKSSLNLNPNVSVFASRYFMYYKPLSIDISTSIKDFIRNEIKKERPQFKLSSLILNQLSNDHVFIDEILTHLDISFRNDKIYHLSLITDFLLFLSKSNLEFFILSNSKGINSINIQVFIKDLFNLKSNKNIQELIGRCVEDKSFRFLFWHYLATEISQIDEDYIVDIIDKFNKDYNIELLCFVYKYNNENFKKCFELFNKIFNVLNLSIFHLFDNKWDKDLKSFENIEQQYFFTEEIINKNIDFIQNSITRIEIVKIKVVETPRRILQDDSFTISTDKMNKIKNGIIEIIKNIDREKLIIDLNPLKDELENYFRKNNLYSNKDINDSLAFRFSGLEIGNNIAYLDLLISNLASESSILSHDYYYLKEIYKYIEEMPGSTFINYFV